MITFSSFRNIIIHIVSKDALYNYNPYPWHCMYFRIMRDVTKYTSLTPAYVLLAHCDHYVVVILRVFGTPLSEHSRYVEHN